MLAPVPTNASISSIKLFNDDLDSGTTNTTDVGLYSTAIAALMMMLTLLRLLTLEVR